MYNAKVKVILSTPWRLRRQPCQMFSERNTIIWDITAYKTVYTFKGILCYMLPVLQSTGRQINVTFNSIFNTWNFVKLQIDMRSTILLMHTQLPSKEILVPLDNVPKQENLLDTLKLLLIENLSFPP